MLDIHVAIVIALVEVDGRRGNFNDSESFRAVSFSCMANCNGVRLLCSDIVLVTDTWIFEYFSFVIYTLNISEYMKRIHANVEKHV